MPHEIVVASKSGFTGGLKRMFMNKLREGGINPLSCFFTHLSGRCAVSTGKKAKDWELHELAHQTVYKRLAPYRDYRLVICNDPVFLAAISDGRHRSLYQCRGSVYRPWPDRPPIIVFDDISKTRWDKHAPLVQTFDVKKAKRWAEGRQIPQPPNYYTLVNNLSKLEQFRIDGERALAMAVDVETSGAGPTAQITVSGYAMLLPDFTIHTYVIPFVAPWIPPDAQFFSDDELEKVLDSVRSVHGTDAIKILQNGAYDCTYFQRFRLPLRNYVYDTAVASHALWVTQPKRLDFLASIFCDFYSFWKDERAESAADDAEKSDVKVPQTKEGFIRYCRYNAADCYYTLIVALLQSSVLNQEKHDWAADNFTRHMRAWVGPAFHMTSVGVAVDDEIRHAMSEFWLREHDQNLADLRTMTHSPEFNPNSPAQVAAFLYDFLRTDQIPRKGKSADEKVLKLVSTQGVIERSVINQISKTKKPANNNSKYGFDPETGRSNLFLLNDRWLYLMNVIGTKMERYASKKHNLWCGTNIQNVPYEVRAMVMADPGYVIIDADYSASDGWFTAYSSDLEKMIEVLHDPRDTHCVHAAEFFKKAYEEIYDGYVSGADWVVHSTEGVRQNTKRVVYGANYLMAGYTMLITMGPEAVIASAVALGHEDARGWGWQRLAEFCQELIDFYFNSMYPGLKAWLDNEFETIAANGGVATAIGGFTRVFFGDIQNDNEIQREAASFFGQAGTARNINDAIDELYYSTDFVHAGGRIYFQCHDSIVAGVPAHLLHELVPVLAGAMDNCRTSFAGKEFHVPVSVDVGLGWGKSMLMKYREDLTYSELQQHHAQARAKLLEKYSV